MRALRLAAEGEARQRLLIHQDPPTSPRARETQRGLLSFPDLEENVEINKLRERAHFSEERRANCAGDKGK
ncbi:hypothetical protein KM043_011146 [Ampulex compressa]|nr:hypothetical protein KM043_011146 [Ampulex compressa]